MEGYLHPLYAKSFNEIGEPLYLPRSKGWLIKRQISGTPYFDAMGPYPLFFCDDWHLLIEDLDALKNSLVSIAFVIDPFAKFPQDQYKEYFDIFLPYKDHYIYDSAIPIEQSISKNHRRSARRALRDVSVDLVVSPNIELDEWVTLYCGLIERHKIKGIRAFSAESFAKQISIPNTLFFRAWHNGNLVGGNLFYIQGDIAYGHLMALTEEGYALSAAHAIKWVALDYLTKRVKYINFGGATGGNQGGLTGLDQFKSGWTNKIGRSFFCGKIFDEKLYDDLTKSRNRNDDHWFPAYRFGDY